MSEPMPQDEPQEEAAPVVEAKEEDLVVVDTDDDWAED
jgi:hypothetical protein